MSELVEITGTIQKFFRDCPKDNGWFGCHFKLDNGLRVRLTGVVKDISLEVGKTYDIVAMVERDDQYGDSYIARHISNSVMNMSARNIIKYFSSKAFNGIGKSTAIKLYREFGKDIYDVIENEPDKLRAIGISDKKIDILKNGVQSNSIYATILRIAPSLSDNMIDNIIGQYGRRAIEILRDRPYDLLYSDPAIKGLNFKTVDGVALGNGIEMDSDYRVSECMKYSLTRVCANKSCSYLNLSDASEYQIYINDCISVINSVNVHMSDVENRITELLRNPNDDSSIVVEQVGTEYHMYDRMKFDTEENLAQIVASMATGHTLFNLSMDDLNRMIDDYCTHECPLDGEQIQAVINSLTNRLSIITGGPGRGKTSVVRCIIWIWKKVFHRQPVLLAPTGKAVCRLNEATGETNGKTIARTIFRACTPAYEQDMRLYKNNLIIVDECSMVGNKTALDMLSLYQFGQVILVGDVDQLPSIEYGQFFRDICASTCVPKVTLLTNHRSKGLIVPNADRINKGVTAEKLKWDVVNGSFVLYQYSEDNYQDHVVKEYMDLISNKANKVDYKSMKDVCILCPSQKRATGSRYINYILQQKLNPSNPKADIKQRGFTIPGTMYKINDDVVTQIRVGDRVIYTKNHPDFVYEKDGMFDQGIANGDCGIIVGLQKEIVPLEDGAAEINYLAIFKTDDGRTFKIDSIYLEEFELAYAITVHKSQGSEYKTVIFSAMSAITEWGDFSNRNLLYTAVTRAKDNVIMVGSVDAVNKCILTEAKERNSALSQKIEAFANCVQEEGDE